jgi:hypothetical protein
MSAVIFMSCTEHPGLRLCEDDEAFNVETVASARALLAAMHPETAATKVAYIALSCEIDSCTNRLVLKADSVTEARIKASHHDRAWYLARRAGGRLVDGCQWHMGSCCIQHARRPSWTLDQAAVLPGDLEFPGQADAGTAQLDLFALEAR